MAGVFVVRRISEFYPYLLLVGLLHYALPVIEIDRIICVRGVMPPSAPVGSKAIHGVFFCGVVGAFLHRDGVQTDKNHEKQ